MRGYLRKILVILAAVFLMPSVGGLALAEEKIPLFLQNEDAQSALSETSRRQDGRLLVPAAVLQRNVYHNITLKKETQSMLVRFALPRAAVGNRAVDRLLFSSLQLELPLKMVAGEGYVDADTAGKLLGYDLHESEGKAVLKPNVYTSFSPRILTGSEMEPLKEDERIHLLWQPTFEAEHNLSLIEKQAGVNVVSPSWFAIADGQGHVKNHADAAYVQRSHERGYQVWPLITNSFDADITHAVLHDEKARLNVIRQLALYVRLYELDGINLDFENIYARDREALTAFVAEIAVQLRAIGAVVSMDVTVPSDNALWSNAYDRAALSRSLDHMMVMAYDEHWRTSPVSGSVASLGWVEQGVVNMLKEVPAKKLVLGVPFYMRKWQENEAGVKAATLSMPQAEKLIADKKIAPRWLEDAGQYYFEYKEGGNLYRVWQEEERSLALKADLIAKYRLAGVAAWRKGFESPGIQRALDERLRPEKKTADRETKQKKTDKKSKKAKD